MMDFDRNGTAPEQWHKLADAFERSADWLDKGTLTGTPRTHPLVGTADYRLASAGLRILADARIENAIRAGRNSAFEAAAQECEALTRNSSPQRRIAGEDMARSIRKLKHTDGVDGMGQHAKPPADVVDGEKQP